MNHRKQNIIAQEETLNQTTVLLEELNELLDKWKAQHPQFKDLMNYYGSEEWTKDVEDSDKGLFDDINHGVLSQDAVYNLFHDNRNAAIKMIRTALEFLEE